MVQNAIPFDEFSNEKYSKKKIPFKILVFRVFLYFFLQISEKLADESLFGSFSKVTIVVELKHRSFLSASEKDTIVVELKHRFGILAVGSFDTLVFALELKAHILNDIM